MATHDLRTRERDSLARFLGWFGFALGTAQLAAPRTLCRLVGAEPDGRSSRIMRAMGARELTQGAGILIATRPAGWLWSRVAGDALDLGALGYLAARHRRARTAAAIANVAPIAAADVFEALHLSRRSGEPRSGKRVRKAVTIRRPRHEVEQAWQDAADLRRKVDEHGADVTFAEAPGDRGTELAVELRADPPGGDFGVVVTKLIGRDLPTQLADDLRRFKAQVETGEIPRSDSTPDGHLLAEHLRQRAAQPLEASNR